MTVDFCQVLICIDALALVFLAFIETHIEVDGLVLSKAGIYLYLAKKAKGKRRRVK